MYRTTRTTAALVAAFLLASLPCPAGAEEVPDPAAEDAPDPMSQLGMTVAAADDRDRTIGELGRRAAEKAWEARSSAEMDSVLSAFRRTMERCIEVHRRPAPPDSGTVRPMLDAMETEAVARRQLDIWAATPEQAALWNASGIPDAKGCFRGVGYRLREGQTTVVAPTGPYCGEDADSYGDASRALWRLETYPQWCFRDSDVQGGCCTGYLLLATRLEPDGSPCFGEPSEDDTLLLRWVRDDGTAPPDDGQFLGMHLYPLRRADSVVRSGSRLEVDTAWRSRNDGGPVVYLRDAEDGVFGLQDRTATRLHDAFCLYMAQNPDALGGSAGIPPWPEEAGLRARAVWRHPLPESALRNYIRSHSPQSADEFAPIPEFDSSGSGPATDSVIDLPEETALSLLALYLDRASFEHSDTVRSEKAAAVVDGWRTESEPPILTIRAEGIKPGSGEVAVCADFSVSRDGAWLFIEDGYRMPELATEDGRLHHRIEDGGNLFAMPEGRRDAVRALLASFPREGGR